MYNSLTFFNFKVYIFRIVEKDGEFKPNFMKGHYASGHASKNDIKWAIETINPNVIIQVHTDNHSWFNNNFNSPVPEKEGFTFKL